MTIARVFFAIMLVLSISLAYYNTVEKEEFYLYTYIKVPEVKTMEFPNLHGVYQIGVSPEKQVDHVRMSVMSTSAEKVPGIKYKISEVSVSKYPYATDITFQVPKKWISDKDLTSGDINVYFTAEEATFDWTKIPLTKLAPDAENEYYKATGLDELGIFAIVGEKPAPVAAPVTEENATTTPTADATVNFDINGWSIGLAVLLLLVGLAGLGYYYYSDGQKFKPAI